MERSNRPSIVNVNLNTTVTAATTIDYIQNQGASQNGCYTWAIEKPNRRYGHAC